MPQMKARRLASSSSSSSALFSLLLFFHATSSLTIAEAFIQPPLSKPLSWSRPSVGPPRIADSPIIIRRGGDDIRMAADDNGPMGEEGRVWGVKGQARREVAQGMMTSFLAGLMAVTYGGGRVGVSPAWAAGAKKAARVEQAKQALEHMEQLPDALKKAEQLAAAKDWPALRELFEDPVVTGFEKDSLAILQADVLGPEDKITIGTIKRYGVAADVLITLGGAKSSIDEENQAETQRLLKLAKQSLQEVLTICENYPELTG